MTIPSIHRIPVTRRAFVKGNTPTDRYNKALAEYARDDFLLKDLYPSATAYADDVLRKLRDTPNE